MAENNENPFGDDFCEYVHNPLMRQYQAIMRMLSMLRDSQRNCNDHECLTSDGASGSSMLVQPPSTDPSSMTGMLISYGPMLLMWALFVFGAFMLMPSSLRRSNRGEPNKDPLSRDSPSSSSSHPSHNNRRRDDDDASTN